MARFTEDQFCFWVALPVENCFMYTFFHFLMVLHMFESPFLICQWNHEWNKLHRLVLTVNFFFSMCRSHLRTTFKPATSTANCYFNRPSRQTITITISHVGTTGHWNNWPLEQLAIGETSHWNNWLSAKVKSHLNRPIWEGQRHWPWLLAPNIFLFSIVSLRYRFQSICLKFDVQAYFAIPLWMTRRLWFWRKRSRSIRFWCMPFTPL